MRSVFDTKALRPYPNFRLVRADVKNHAKDVHLLDMQYRIPTEINRFPSQEYSTSEPDAMAQMQQMSQQGGEPVMGMNQDGMIQGPGGPTGHYRDRTSDDDLNDTTPW